MCLLEVEVQGSAFSVNVCRVAVQGSAFNVNARE